MSFSKISSICFVAPAVKFNSLLSCPQMGTTGKDTANKHAKIANRFFIVSPCSVV